MCRSLKGKTLRVWLCCVVTSIGCSVASPELIACEGGVCLYGDSATRVLFFRNPYSCPVTVEVSPQLGVDGEIAPDPIVLRVPAKGESDHVKTDAASLSFRHMPGDFRAGTPQVVYQLPFHSLPPRQVLRSWGDAPTHVGPQRYSVDFAMEVGSHVLAARDGVVVYREDRWSESGLPASEGHKVNELIICHDDGTLTSYLHLMHDGIRPCLGQHVRAGDVVAFSGVTGAIVTPHLHFSAWRPDQALRADSLPVRFETVNGEIGKLVVGEDYRPAAPIWRPLGAAPICTPECESGSLTYTERCNSATVEG